MCNEQLKVGDTFVRTPASDKHDPHKQVQKVHYQDAREAMVTCSDGMVCLVEYNERTKHWQQIPDHYYRA